MKRITVEIKLKEKYNEINVEQFLSNFKQGKKEECLIEIREDILDILKKLEKEKITKEEVIDLLLRYSLGKREVRKMLAKLIEQKENSIYNWDDFIML